MNSAANSNKGRDEMEKGQKMKAELNRLVTLAQCAGFLSNFGARSLMDQFCNGWVNSEYVVGVLTDAYMSAEFDNKNLLEIQADIDFGRLVNHIKNPDRFSAPPAR